MTRTALPLALILSASGIAAAVPAPAPAPASAPSPVLRNHDSNAPVNVDADRLEVQDRADRAVFSGNVKAVQGDLTLTAQRVSVAYSRTRAAAAGGADANPQIDRIDASGRVVVQSPGETATGNAAIYDLNRRLITMLGNVSLVRQGNRVNGGRLVLDLNSGRATVDGSAVGGSGGSIATGRGGRVSGRFTVPQRSN